MSFRKQTQLFLKISTNSNQKMAPEKHPSVRKADYLKFTFSKTSCTWNIWDPKISLSPSFEGSVFLQKTIKISFLKGCKCSKYPPKNKKNNCNMSYTPEWTKPKQRRFGGCQNPASNIVCLFRVSIHWPQKPNPFQTRYSNHSTNPSWFVAFSGEGVTSKHHLELPKLQLSTFGCRLWCWCRLWFRNKKQAGKRFGKKGTWQLCSFFRGKLYLISLDYGNLKAISPPIQTIIYQNFG